MTTKVNRSALTLKKLEAISGKSLTLGNMLWSIRIGEGLSQVEFARKLGVSKQYLCDLENGRRFSSPKSAAEYAKKLGYSDQQFVRLSLQDIVDRDCVNLRVEVKSL